MNLNKVATHFSIRNTQTPAIIQLCSHRITIRKTQFIQKSLDNTIKGQNEAKGT